MTPDVVVTRRAVWIGMLLYPRHTLPTALAPVAAAIGLAAHDGVLAVGPAVAAFVSGWFIQLGGVVTDNYHNLTRHPDDREHALFVEALRRGVVTMVELRRAIYGCYLAAAVVGGYLVYVGGLPVALVGLASAAASLAYSSNPFPLGDHGLGDPLFFVFFGPVSVVAAYYVQAAATLAPSWPLTVPAGTVTGSALAAGLAIGALTTNILLVDNIRDLEYDRSKGERTLAVIIGAGWTRIEYAALLAFAYLMPLWFWFGAGFGPSALLPWLSLPYGVLVARRVWRARTHEALMPMSPQAGQVLLAYSLLFALGVAR
jgi:1,4-dihydroxy-2-naphthoate octaprenyltransferase